MTSETPMTNISQIAPRAPTPAYNGSGPRNSATNQLRAKLSNDLKNLRGNRNKLVAELYEKKAQVDDVDVAIETTVSAINSLDHQKLKVGEDEGTSA
jgi:seryl-tRNA synthetase